MANLLNAVLQTPSSNGPVSPDSGATGVQAKELGKLFQNSLKSAVSEAGTEPTNPQDLIPREGIESEVALANGMISTPVSVTPQSVSKAENQVEKDLFADQDGFKKSSLGQNDAKATEPKSAELKSANQTDSGKLLLQSEQWDDSSVLPANLQSMSLQAMMGGSGFELNEAEEIPGGASLADLSGFDLQDVSSVELKKPNQKPLSSKFSTTDFLNLRGISQLSGKNVQSIKPEADVRDLAKNTANSASMNPKLQGPGLDPSNLASLQAPVTALGLKPLQQKKSSDGKELENGITSLSSPVLQQMQSPVLNEKTMDATVTSSATGKNTVLSNESINQIASQVNLLGQARQDGEIKIRLRPDHLGELQMSIRTQGQNVSVQIKAQNEDAKRIIEDSISSLRDHLSIHQLALASVDVVSQPSTPSGLEQGQMQLDSGRQQNEFANGSGREFAQDDSRRSSQEFGFEQRNFVKPQSTFRSQSRTVDSSRLDLIA
jgi:flagellar hook-length control protein FliK